LSYRLNNFWHFSTYNGRVGNQTTYDGIIVDIINLLIDGFIAAKLYWLVMVLPKFELIDIA